MFLYTDNLFGKGNTLISFSTIKMEETILMFDVPVCLKNKPYICISKIKHI